MAMSKSKDATGRVNTENIKGAKVPRKGLNDETTGKSAGTRNIRSVGGRFFRFAGEGRK
jgi:hypothetical protein